MTDGSNFITLVLGAGASFEVAMPTGNELKGKIASSLSFKVDGFRRLSGGDSQLRETLYQLGQRNDTGNSLQSHIDAARLICAGMPQAPSIDNFIDSHRSNPHIAAVGKLAIATEILKAERASTLYVNPSNIYNQLDFPRVADTWFNAFFQLISLNAQEENLPERLAKVRVVTFNYDRTLEHFLFHSIQNYYGSSAERAAELLTHLVVLHPYGKVGSLPWQKADIEVPFGGGMHASALLQVSDLLRTFTEGTTKEGSSIEAIRTAIIDAEILVFLGFAYHELNLQLLFDLQGDMPVRHAKRVFGTAMGLSESNKNLINLELSRLGRYDSSRITLRRDLSAAQLLPEYSRTLRIPSVA